MAALVPRRLFAPWLSARASRSLAASAALCAKTQSKATSLDPVQQLFLEKLKEYETKSSGGKLPDMTPEIERQFKDEMERTKRIFGGGDMTEFPKFNFVDKAPSADRE